MANTVHGILPGDYSLLSCRLMGSSGTIVDVSDYVIELNIYEDIFSPYLSATAVVQDPEALIESLPIIGEEKLILKFTTSQSGGYFTFDKIFNVYKITDVQSNRNEKFYTLHMVTPIATLNNNMRISKSYRGYSHDIVQKILKQTMKLTSEAVKIERSKYIREFIAPNWKPLKVINHLAQTSIRADSNDDREADFVFFENKAGFNFVSLTSLMDAPVTDTLIDHFEDNQQKNLMNGVSRIHIPHYYDNLKAQLLGMYGAKVYAHDIINKEVKEFTYGYEGNKVQTEVYTPDNRLYFVPHNYDLAQSCTFASAHPAQINQIKEGISVVVEVPGNTNLTLGDMVQYKMKSSIDDGNPSIHRTLPTKHLITKIKHTLFNGKHTMTLELSSRDWR